MLGVLLLLSFCWSFYFYYNYSEKGKSLSVSGELQAGCNKEIPIYSVNTKNRQIALTFDSAWNTDDLDDILETLNDNDVVATFFVTGDFALRYKEYVKKIYDKGHEIGNHGQNHKLMSTLTEEECSKEIREAENSIYKATGVITKLFRPPSGDYDKEVINCAAAMGYYSIQWDVDSLDWKNYGKEDIIERTLNHKNLKNGSIILMHNGTKYTASALKELIDGLKSKGYEFVKVSDLIYKDSYVIDHAGVQKKE